MQYEELEPEEQVQLQDLVNNQRSFDVLMSQVVTIADALASAWTGGTSSIINKLDANAVIPNTSGYAGAQGVTVGDVAQTITQCMVICDQARPVMGDNNTGGGYNTDVLRQLRIKFCGINASI